MSDPYKTPEAEVSNDSHREMTGEAELASRWARLGAAIIDSIVGIALAVPFWMATGIFEMMGKGQQPPYEYTLMGVVYGFVMFILVQGYFLAKDGQTIGKKALAIKITDMNGNILTLSAVLLKRYLPMSAVSLIPVLGGFLAIIDVLFIFRKDKRCVHDLIAGSKVVKI